MRSLRSTATRSLIAAAVAVVTLAGVASAGTPTQLKDPSRIAAGNLSELSLAVDSVGHVHMAAVRNGGDLVYLTDRTGPFTEVTVANDDISGESGYRWEAPSLALDENDRVTIAVVKTDWGGTGCDCTRGIFTFSDKGRARGTFPAAGTKRVGAGSHSPSLKTVGGHIHIAYRKGATVPEESAAIRYKTNATGSWTDTKVKSFPYRYSVPSLRIGSNGRARIAFDASGIFVATATTKAGGFVVDKVTGSNSHDQHASLSLTSTGKPAVAFVRGIGTGKGIHYASKATGTWADTLVAGHVADPALSLDSADAPFIAVADSIGADAGLWTYAGPTFIEDELFGPAASDAQVRIGGSGIVTLAFTTQVAPKGIYLTQD